MTTIAVPGTVPYEVHVGRGVLDGLVEQLGPDVTKVLIVHQPSLATIAGELRTRLTVAAETLACRATS